MILLTRSTSLATVSLLCLVAMPAAGAMGATKKKSPARPTVRSVAPMQAGVGDQLTIKGRNFLLGKKRNTIFFKAGSRPAVYVKAEQATRTTIKVVIPKSVEKYISVKDGVAQPTRFRLRVLSKRFAKGYTAVRLSPTIALGNVPGPAGAVAATGPAPDCDADGIVNSVDADDDNDLLSDAAEAGLKLNPCAADSDADGVEDGFEYQSALDLNRTQGQVTPHPDKRPYPNPLDGGDARTDYDGDGLTMAQEHLMWKAYGPQSLTLSYSAGLKKSTSPFTPVSCAPIANAGCNDDFRDVDGDGLGNWDEFNGRMTPEWWTAKYPTEVAYPELYLGTNAVDPDTDGDGVTDGADDIDHDDTDPGPGVRWTNVQELSREASGYRVNPFNPCLPDPENSPTCSEHPPFSNPYAPYDTGWTIVPIPWPQG